jgi:WD40 repeat protein
VSARRRRFEVDAEGEVTAVAISPDGRLLATACEGKGSILLWHLGDGERAAGRGDKRAANGEDRAASRAGEVAAGPAGARAGELTGHDIGTTALVFGPDGKTLVSGGGDQAIRFWDLARGIEAAEPVGAGGTVAGLAIDASGSLLATAAHWPGGVMLRGLRPPGAARELPTRTPGGANSLAFSPDGHTLAFSADEFGMTIVLWDVARAGPRVELGARASTTSLVFVPGSARLASGHFDGSVVLAHVDIARWPERACAIANRNLTREEWHAAVGDSLPYRVPCPGLPVPKVNGKASN